jgi:hypothetical protein
MVGPAEAWLLIPLHAAFAAHTKREDMMKSLWKTALAAAVLFGAALAGPGMAKECDHCEESDGACNEAAILAADQALQQDIAAHGVVAAFSAALSDDGQLIATGQPILTGRQAVVSFLQSSTPSGSKLTWIVGRGDVAAVGDLGYTWGWTTFTAPGGAVTTGHYMAMWRRNHGHGNRAYTLQVYMRYTALPRTPPPAGFGPLAPPVDFGDRIDPAHALTQLNTLDNEFSALAVAKGQSVAHEEFAAVDAVEMLTDVTYGRDAIVASHANDGFVLSWISIGGSVSESGDLGYTTGSYVVTVPGTTISIPGHFLTIWKRQPDGQWRYVVGAGT